MYELVSISCGELSVQYTTDDLKELGRLFQSAETSRIRHNGKLLTFAEARELLGENSKVMLMPRVVKPKKSSKKANCKAVEKIDDAGNVLARYATIQEAAEANFFASHQPVSRACKTGKPTMDGSKFRFAEEQECSC